MHTLMVITILLLFGLVGYNVWAYWDIWHKVQKYDKNAPGWQMAEWSFYGSALGGVALLLMAIGAMFLSRKAKLKAAAAAGPYTEMQ